MKQFYLNANHIINEGGVTVVSPLFLKLAKFIVRAITLNIDKGKIGIRQTKLRKMMCGNFAILRA